jgi:hypothetical protein
MKTQAIIDEWLPLEEAAKHFGYQKTQSFTHRLRQLRKRGFVIDIGHPPSEYPIGNANVRGKIVLMWPNPKAALLHKDAPQKLLVPKKGKRSKVGLPK